MGAASIPQTRGVVTALAADEVAALAAMGLGAPLVLPAIFGETEPASLDQLRDHLLVDESGTPLPWFAAIWSCVVQPRVIGVVSRHAGEAEYAWLFYLRAGSFVEQVNQDRGIALLGGPLEDLPVRLALAAGLWHGQEINQQAADPLASSSFGLSLRFTRVGGPTFAADIERTSTEWLSAGSSVETTMVVAEIDRVVSSAFGAEPHETS